MIINELEFLRIPNRFRRIWLKTPTRGTLNAICMFCKFLGCHFKTEYLHKCPWRPLLPPSLSLVVYSSPPLEQNQNTRNAATAEHGKMRIWKTWKPANLEMDSWCIMSTYGAKYLVWCVDITYSRETLLITNNYELVRNPSASRTPSFLCRPVGLPSGILLLPDNRDPLLGPIGIL